MSSTRYRGFICPENNNTKSDITITTSTTTSTTTNNGKNNNSSNNNGNEHVKIVDVESVEECKDRIINWDPDTSSPTTESTTSSVTNSPHDSPPQPTTDTAAKEMSQLDRIKAQVLARAGDFDTDAQAVQHVVARRLLNGPPRRQISGYHPYWPALRGVQQARKLVPYGLGNFVLTPSPLNPDKK